MIVKNKKISFVKLVGAGNDFVFIDNRVCRISSVARLKVLARKMCGRKFGLGADGLLVLEKSGRADSRMRIFNADGSEAQMCGNGARCFAYYLSGGKQSGKVLALTMETKAGIVNALVNGDNIKINLTQPKSLRLGILLKVGGRDIKVDFINTGVPHTVIFVEGLDKIDVKNLGREIRYHQFFAPAGTNVNFVEIIGPEAIKIRTYERGVEDETLACGTGSTAAALIAGLKVSAQADKFNVHTAGGEILKIYFTRVGKTFKDVWLEGRAKLICRGEYYV